MGSNPFVPTSNIKGLRFRRVILRPFHHHFRITTFPLRLLVLSRKKSSPPEPGITFFGVGNVSKTIFSLQKGLDILCCFDEDHEVLSALEISERLNIPLSTTYRYLTVLVEKGFLAKDFETNKHGLGPMILQIGSMQSQKDKRLNVVKPHLKTLAALTGETVILTVMRGWKGVCLDRIESRKIVRVSVRRGSSVPLHAGAPEKVLLAYQGDVFVDAMVKKVGLSKLSDNTITDPGELKKELRRIRQEGIAFSDSEVESSARSFAAPIFDHRGGVVASIGVNGPMERIKGVNAANLIDLVKKTALEISRDLGCKNPMLRRPSTDSCSDGPDQASEIRS